MSGLKIARHRKNYSLRRKEGWVYFEGVRVVLLNVAVLGIEALLGRYLETCQGQARLRNEFDHYGSLTRHSSLSLDFDKSVINLSFYFVNYRKGDIRKEAISAN